MSKNLANRLQTESTREMRTSDPYPWMCIDHDGEVYRVHTAHEDGYDANGNLWQGWTYSPRTAEQLAAAGY